MNDLIFLTKEQVLHLHQNTIRDHGGRADLRDEGLLLSALAQPEASFGGQYLHRTIYLMAAAYFFHISQNQPFTDGNKRVGFLSLFTFLEINGYELTVDDNLMYPKLMCVAEGHCRKDDLAYFIEQYTKLK